MKPLFTSLQRSLLLITNRSTIFTRTFTQITLQHSLEPPQTDTNTSVHSISSDPMFSLLGLCNSIPSLKKIHAVLLLHGLSDHDLLFQTKLVSLYGSFGLLDSARLVFNRIKNPDLYSWKVMMRWYFLNDLYSEIIMFYRCMNQCLREHDNVAFSIVLKACTELHDFVEGKKVHCRIVKEGSPDSFVFAGLVDMYAKSGEIESARFLFEQIPDRNVVSWTSMIVGCVQNDCSEEGLVLFNRMRQCMVGPNAFTVGSLLSACTKLEALHQGKWVHGYTIKNCNCVNTHVIASLVDLYVKCGSVADARLFFDESGTVDLVPWTAMIVGYAQRNLPNEALMLFTDKRWKTVVPNSVTIASVVSACAQSGNTNLGRSVHCLGMKRGAEDTTVKNALVYMYAKYCMIGDASYIFETISDKNIIAWNSMITGYSENGNAYEALQLFHRMRNSFSIDATTVVAVLSACAVSGARQTGCGLHAYIVKDGFVSSSVYVGTALLTFYSKCGDSDSARRVFDEMKEKNMVTWSSMITGYGMHGDACGSLSLFGDMLNENVEPNEAVFTSVLSACSHTGMIGEGWKFFDSMCKEYHVVPSMRHYVCMIDLLARAGRLEEALEFIEKMPVEDVEADARVWGALLHGCGLYSRFDIGKMAIRKMLELQPDDAGYYVLIANLCASDGRWEEGSDMRKLMMGLGLSKSPGSSQLELDNNEKFPVLRIASL